MVVRAKAVAALVERDGAPTRIHCAEVQFARRPQGACSRMGERAWAAHAVRVLHGRVATINARRLPQEREWRARR